MDKKIKYLSIFIIILSITILIFSIINIIRWKIDSNKTNEQIESIQKEVEIINIVDSKETEIIKQEEIPKFDPYWDYIKMDMLDVNFNDLKKINNNVKGWIQLNGTTINYPFVQAKDNKYYLSHSFDNSINSAGWLFLDYRNNFINNKNTIIYAHGRTDKTMFGSLRDVLSNEWLSNSSNFVVKVSTEKESGLYQIFSVYRIKNTNDYITTEFNDDIEYQEFLNMLLNRSFYNFNTSINSTDNILTLSTCYNDYEKIVVHAKLIKRIAKN